MAILQRTAAIGSGSFAPAALWTLSRGFFTLSPQQPGPFGAKPFFREDTQKETVHGQQQQLKKCELPDSEGAVDRMFGAKTQKSTEYGWETREGNTQSFSLSDTLSKCTPAPLKIDASLAKGILNVPYGKGRSGVEAGEEENRKEYTEHCILGWSPQDLYRVVADVAQYSNFLPWCMESIVHDVKHVGPALSDEESAAVVPQDCMAMIATLTVGFAFHKEKYTSDVLLIPGSKVRAMLHEQTMRKTPVLRDLFCEWQFYPVAGNDQCVEVNFLVSFAFRNPLHSKLIMSNIVSFMTKSFEKRCENLYGPPSCQRKPLGN